MGIFCLIVIMLSNPTFLGAMFPLKTHVITMFALGKALRIILLANGLRRPHPRLSKGHRCLHQRTCVSHHQCLHRSSQCGSFLYALGEGRADHFVCKWGGLRPQSPRFFKAIDASNCLISYFHGFRGHYVSSFDVLHHLHYFAVFLILSLFH